jgi:hypothetical protein
MDSETVPDRLQGRWRACAVKVHVLIRGDLCRVPVSRACPKGGATGGNSASCAQKSAEAVVPTLQAQWRREGPKGHAQVRVTCVSRCRLRKGASHRMVVNHLRRWARFNGLGPGFGQRLKTRAQPPGADPHARWCGRGSGATRTPIPMYARHGRELVGCKSPGRKRELIGGQDTKCKPTKQVLGEGNCGRVTDRGKEACECASVMLTRNRRQPHSNAKAARLRTETPYEAQRDAEVSCRWTAKPFPTRSRVHGELVQ